MMHAVERDQPGRRLQRLLCTTLWVVYGLWVLRAGVRTGVDTALYSLWVDSLIAHSFDIPSYLNDQNFQTPPILYVGWIVVAATLKVAFGASWLKAIVFLNWLAFGAGLYAVLNAVRRTTSSATSVLLAAALFLVAGDLLIFIPFALSDLIFWGMASVVLAIGCELATRDTDQGRVALAVLGTLLVLIALVFRPVGLPVLAFWVAALASSFARELFDRSTTAIVVMAIATALVMTIGHAAIMIDPSAWPLGKIPGFFEVLSQEYRSGVLVYAPESNLRVEPAVTVIGAIRLTLQKLAYFMTPWLPSYSTAHALINLAFFVPAYGLSVAAVVRRDRLSLRQRRAVAILVLFVFSLAVFHPLVQIEYDHRYRLPMLPALIMLAALGLESYAAAAAWPALAILKRMSSPGSRW